MALLELEILSAIGRYYFYRAPRRESFIVSKGKGNASSSNITALA
jgi:hypothetical protein